MLSFFNKGKSVKYNPKSSSFEITVEDKNMMGFLKILTAKNPNVVIKGKKITLKVTNDLEATEVLLFLKLSGNV